MGETDNLPMLTNLIHLILGTDSSSDKSRSDSSEKHLQVVRGELKQTPRYPPFDQGMPLEDIDEIIESQKELIEKLRSVCGFNPAGFEQRMMSVIRNYARYVHLLPASRDDHHKGAGGLFRLGLEVGFASMQSAGGKLFGGRESAERRKILQPRWVYGTFIAGLCCEIHRPITSMSIVDHRGEAWQQFMQPLYDWGINNQVERYYIHWSDSKSSQQWYSTAAYLLNNIIPQECLQYLNEDNAQIVAAMTASITGAARYGDGNLLAEVVTHSRDLVIDKDIKANPSFYGRFTVGAHLEPHLWDAMRELIRSGEWKINGKQARIWYTREGMFLVWSPAFSDMQQLLKSRMVSGLPQNQDTMADLMLGPGMIEPNKQGGPYWEIMLPGNGKLINAVKISDPRVLLGNETVEFANAQLLLGDAAAEVRADEQLENQKPTEPNNPVAPAVAPTKGSIPPSKAKGQVEQDPAVLNSDDLFNQLSEDSRRLLLAIRGDYLNGESEHPVWMSAKGLIISTKEFNSHGISTIKVIDDLRKKNWLLPEPGTTRFIMKTEKDGEKIDGYLINRQIALSLGFKEI